MQARQITLASRPVGMPTAETFGSRVVELAPPGDGEVLVRWLFLSVDPYMRGRMNAARSYVPPFEVGEPLVGSAVGEVVESRSAAFAAGDLVMSMASWSDYEVKPVHSLRRVEPAEGVSASAYLGVLGMPGFTAYIGLTRFGEPKAGEVLFVSGAAGAVGSTVGQIAKLMGLKVIGSAGGPAKAARLGELGFDVGIDYRSGDIVYLLAEAAPDGIDVYVGNVGGSHLIAALEASRDYARFVMCGSISGYNSKAREPGPWNLFRVVQRRLTLRGFIVSDHGSAIGEFTEKMSGWIRAGEVKYDETIVKGLENAPEAFLGLFSGANLGKMVVEL
ncbi:MAG: NADP-dependent oxidoreductase [Actinomycetota bacterium]|nr:NADP-dependent oxidoreductase [Actinomycetota bacterium]